MLRAKYIERMGTGIKKMRSLAKKEGLKPIKFKFTNFTTLTCYRKHLPGGYVIKSPEVVARENFIKKLSKILRVREIKVNELLKILHHIETNNFSKQSYSKNNLVALRTLNEDITLLKKQKNILFEGSKKTGKYKVTKKYKKLKSGTINDLII